MDGVDAVLLNSATLLFKAAARAYDAWQEIQQAGTNRNLSEKKIVLARSAL
jgi:hypothetical protein